MNIKYPLKLVISIVVAQSAGLIGTVFTISAIPTWYAYLNKPIFSPPNWLFGPVWTVLYTLIGISLYRIWIKNKKSSLKLFFFHLFLNAIWSPVFFGAKNLGLAFLIILLMDVTLIIIIKRFIKIDKLAAYLLVPYLLWISFASLLNFSLWTLNINNVSAQTLTAEDKYKNSLSNFELKKGSYLKNPTLSVKEDLRLSLLDLLTKRSEYKKWYLEQLKSKFNYPKLDSEVSYYTNNLSLEDLVLKSNEEDIKYNTTTLPIIYYSLSNIGLENITTLKNKNNEIYIKLKNEANNLVSLGRADPLLFERWFKDIDQELTYIAEIEKVSKDEIENIYSEDSYQRGNAYKKAIEELSLSKTHLEKLNNYIKELDTVISNKR